MRIGAAVFTLCCAFMAQAAGPAVEIPFDFLRNQIVLRGSVNGDGPLLLILDNGTHASTVSLPAARRLGLALGQAVPGTGAGTRRVRARQTQFDIRLGPLEVAQLPGVAMDLSAISRAMGREVDGVLGSSFLAGRIVQVDYFRRRLLFWPQSPFGGTPAPAETESRIVFPMQSVAGSALPLLNECFVNDVRVPITLDTGSSFGLILFPNAIRTLGIEDLAKSGAPLVASGYGGQPRLTKGWVRSLALKKMDLGAVEVAYALGGYGAGSDARRRGGNLGNAILQDFLLTLDYVNRVVVLEKVDDE